MGHTGIKNLDLSHAWCLLYARIAPARALGCLKKSR